MLKLRKFQSNKININPKLLFVGLLCTSVFQFLSDEWWMSLLDWNRLSKGTTYTGQLNRHWQTHSHNPPLSRSVLNPHPHTLSVCLSLINIDGKDEGYARGRHTLPMSMLMMILRFSFLFLLFVLLNIFIVVTLAMTNEFSFTKVVVAKARNKET